jgi:hypothetical protein
MTNDMRAGESRPGRRLALNAAVLLVVALVLLTIGRGMAGNDDHGWSVDQAAFERTDAEIATHLLQSVNGVNDVVCAAVERAFNGGYWNNAVVLNVDATVSPEADETARWIGKNRIDRDVLPIVRTGLASGDACTRRVAARIAGNIDTKRLHDELRAELQSGNALTRLAAVMALGHAEEVSSLPVLQTLLKDGDRNVRLAALWATGALESHEAAPMLINLLEKDPDPDVRRIAAWGLGQLDD